MHQDEGKVVVKDDMLTRQSRKAVQSLRVVADISSGWIVVAGSVSQSCRVTFLTLLFFWQK